MPYIFTDENGKETAGRVVVLENDGDDLPQYVEIGKLIDADNPPEKTGLIVTGSGGRRQAAAQTTPTLGNSLYSYSFGQRPGHLQVNGLAFPQICGNADDGASSPFSGIKTLIEFFDQYNHGIYRDTLMATLQPGLVRDVFLYELQWNYAAAPFRMVEFTLGLELLP